MSGIITIGFMMLFPKTIGKVLGEVSFYLLVGIFEASRKLDEKQQSEKRKANERNSI